jgi:hypothetical protein
MPQSAPEATTTSAHNQRLQECELGLENNANNVLYSKLPQQQVKRKQKMKGELAAHCGYGCVKAKVACHRSICRNGKRKGDGNNCGGIYGLVVVVPVER